MRKNDFRKVQNEQIMQFTIKLYAKYKINQLFPQHKCNITNHICTENEADEFVLNY